MDPMDIPTPMDAANLYRLEGGDLTEEWHVGEDMLHGHDDLIFHRDSLFEQTLLAQVGDAGSIFGALVNGNRQPFQQIILMHIQLSEHLATGI